MLSKQLEINFAAYNEVYNKLIPEDDFFLRLDNAVDFSFVRDRLEDSYSEDQGRPAYDPVMLFKYLLAKKYYKASDREIVRRSMTDLSLKRFLGLDLFDEVIEASTLTRFRRERLKDLGIFDELIKQTTEIAKSKGVLGTDNVITDGTHVQSVNVDRKIHEEVSKETKELINMLDDSPEAEAIKEEYYEQTSQIDYDIKERRKALNRNSRKRYRARESGKPEDSVDQEPVKSKEELNVAERQIQSSKQVIEKIKEYTNEPAIINRIEYLEELFECTDAYVSKDTDAKRGYKTQNKNFFGYKAHIAIEQESMLVIGHIITDGRTSDGSQFQELVDKCRDRMDVKNIIGDTAYSSQANFEYAQENGMRVISKLHPNISSSIENIDRDDFTYNKDSDTVICPSGISSYRKSSFDRKKSNAQTFHFFSKEDCDQCPNRCHNCKEEKVYTVSNKSIEHLKQYEFQQSDEFKDLYKDRYKIESRNADLKNNYDLQRLDHPGLIGMSIEMGSAIFLSNMKRIFKLEDQKKQENEQKVKKE